MEKDRLLPPQGLIISQVPLIVLLFKLSSPFFPLIRLWHFEILVSLRYL